MAEQELKGFDFELPDLWSPIANVGKSIIGGLAHAGTAGMGMNIPQQPKPPPVSPQEAQRMRQAMQQEALALQARQQQAVQQKKANDAALGRKTDSKINQKQDGSFERTDKRTDEFGNTMEVKRTMSPEEQQYRRLLQEGVDRTPQMNLQPLAQLVDAWTGSRMAPAFQDADAQARSRLRERIGYAKALVPQKADPLTALKAAKMRSEIARNLRPPKGQEEKPLTFYQDVLRTMPETPIEGSQWKASLNLYKDRIPQAVANLKLPKGYAPFLEGMRTTEDVGDVRQQIAGMADELSKAYLARGHSKKWVKENLGQIRNTAQLHMNRLDSYLREQAKKAGD